MPKRGRVVACAVAVEAHPILRSRPSQRRSLGQNKHRELLLLLLLLLLLGSLTINGWGL
jgi:hypothetical protein